MKFIQRMEALPKQRPLKSKNNYSFKYNIVYYFMERLLSLFSCFQTENHASNLTVIQ